MKNKEIVTSDLSDFGWREREILKDILDAWNKQNLPKDFYNDEVIPMFNRNSGYVFLTNSEYQTCMMNDDNLEIWFNCCNCGHEGFSEDCQLNDYGCNECIDETELADKEIEEICG